MVREAWFASAVVAVVKPASEQLREMQSRGVRFVVEGTWDDALPEIIAVVKAAEFYLGEHTQGRPALTIGIEQALEQLAAKLSGEAG